MCDCKFDKRIISTGTLVFEKGKKSATEFPTEKEADEYIDKNKLKSKLKMKNRRVEPDESLAYLFGYYGM